MGQSTAFVIKEVGYRVTERSSAMQPDKIGIPRDEARRIKTRGLGLGDHISEPHMVAANRASGSSDAS